MAGFSSTWSFLSGLVSAGNTELKRASAAWQTEWKRSWDASMSAAGSSVNGSIADASARAAKDSRSAFKSGFFDPLKRDTDIYNKGLIGLAANLKILLSDTRTGINSISDISGTSTSSILDQTNTFREEQNKAIGQFVLFSKKAVEDFNKNGLAFTKSLYSETGGAVNFRGLQEKTTDIADSLGITDPVLARAITRQSVLSERVYLGLDNLSDSLLKLSQDNVFDPSQFIGVTQTFFNLNKNFVLTASQLSDNLSDTTAAMSQVNRFTKGNRTLNEQAFQGLATGRAYSQQAGLDVDLGKLFMEAQNDPAAATSLKRLGFQTDAFEQAIKKGGDAIPELYKSFLTSVNDFVAANGKQQFKPVFDTIFADSGIDFEKATGELSQRMGKANKLLTSAYSNLGTSLFDEANFRAGKLKQEIDNTPKSLLERIQNYFQSTELFVKILDVFKDFDIDTFNKYAIALTPLVVLFGSNLKRLASGVFGFPFRAVSSVFKSIAGVFSIPVVAGEGEQALKGVNYVKAFFAATSSVIKLALKSFGSSLVASSASLFRSGRTYWNATGRATAQYIETQAGVVISGLWGMLRTILNSITGSGFINSLSNTFADLFETFTKGFYRIFRFVSVRGFNSFLAILKSFYSGTLGTFSKAAFGSLGKLTGGLFKVLSKLPIISLLISGITGYFQLKDAKDKIAAGAKFAGQTIGTLVGGALGTAVAGPVGGVVGAVLGGFLGDKLGTFLEKPLREFLAKYPQVADSLSRFGNWIKSTVASVGGFLSGVWTKSLSFLTNSLFPAVSKTFSTFISVIQAAWKWLRPVTDVLIPAAIEGFRVLWDVFKSVLIEPIQAVFSFLTSTGGQTTGYFQQLWKDVQPYVKKLGEFLTQIRDWFVQIANFVLPIVFRFARFVGRVLGGAFKVTLGVVGVLANIIVSVLVVAFKWLVNAINFLSPVINFLVNLFLMVGKTIYNAFDAVLPYIVEAFNGLVSIYQTYVAPFFSSFIEILSGLGSTVGQFLSPVLAPLGAAFSWLGGVLWGWMKSFGSIIAKSLPFLLNTGLNVFGTFVDSVGVALSLLGKAFNGFLSLISYVDTGINHMVGSILGAIRNLPFGVGKFISQDTVDSYSNHKSVVDNYKVDENTLKALGNMNTASTLRSMFSNMAKGSVDASDKNSGYFAAQQQTKGFFDSSVPSFTSNVGGVASAIGQTASSAYGAANQRLPQTKQEALSWLGSLRNNALSKIDFVKQRFGVNSPQYKQAMQEANPLLQELDDKRKQVIASTGEGFKKIIGSGAFEGIKKGAQSGLSYVQQLFANNPLNIGVNLGANGVSSTGASSIGSSGFTNAGGFNITSGGANGLKVSAAAIAMNPNGENRSALKGWHHACQALARQAFQSAMGYRHSAFGNSAAESMHAFQSKGIGYAYTSGAPIPVGALVYSSEKYGHGSGHVMIMGSDGMFHDQYGAHAKPITPPEWIVPADGLSAGRGGKVSGYNAQNYVGGSLSSSGFTQLPDTKVRGSFRFSKAFKDRLASNKLTQKEVRTKFHGQWADFYKYYGATSDRISQLQKRAPLYNNTSWENSPEREKLRNEFLSNRAAQVASKQQGLSIGNLFGIFTGNNPAAQDSNAAISSLHSDYLKKEAMAKALYEKRRKSHNNNIKNTPIAYGQWGYKTIKGKRVANPIATPNTSSNSNFSSSSPSIPSLVNVNGYNLPASWSQFQRQAFMQSMNQAKAMGATPDEIRAIVSAGIVESKFNNYQQVGPHRVQAPGGKPIKQDHDSLGLFQQRPSWGSEAQRTDPIYATKAFLNAYRKKAAKFPNLSIGELVQKTQVSAYPTRYTNAMGLVDSILNPSGKGVSGPLVTPSALIANGNQYKAPNGVTHSDNKPLADNNISQFHLSNTDRMRLFGVTSMGQTVGSMVNYGMGRTLSDAYSAVPSALSSEMSPTSMADIRGWDAKNVSSINPISSLYDTPNEKPDATNRDIVQAIHEQTEAINRLPHATSNSASNPNPVQVGRKLPPPAPVRSLATAGKI